MIRYAVRRLLWTLPTLVGISIISFWFLSYVPDPTDDPAIARVTAPADLQRARRDRFLDLPRFVNVAPRDVVARAAQAMQDIAAGGEARDVGADELARLGGAALPYVIPRLDGLGPEGRADVAVALAPIAWRMQLPRRDEASDRDRAAAFWSRFWEDRGIDFRRTSVRSGVNRLLRYHAPETIDDIRQLDTYALPELFATLEQPEDAASLYRARSLVTIIADVTGLEDRIAPGDDVAAGRQCVARWQSFWSVHRADFVELAGPSRLAAMILETRYGHWALGALTLRFGRTSTGETVLDELVGRAPTTILVVFGAIGLAYALALPLAAISAARRNGRVDVGIAFTVLGLYCVPTAAIATLVARLGGGTTGHLVAAIVIVALGLIAAPTGQLRASLAAELGRDYTRAAQARGAGGVRVLLIHALPNAILPFITLASLEAPMALGGAFVVERLFHLHGVGELTIQAVQVRDIAWLMAISIVAGTFAAVYVLLTDIAYVSVDKRLTRFVLGRGRA